GDFVTHAIRLDRLAEKQAELLEKTMADNQKGRDAALGRMWRKVWFQKIAFYLSEEKRLLDKELTICAESLFDRSLLAADTYISAYYRVTGQNACAHDPHITLDQLQFQKAYVDYVITGLAKYAKEVKKAQAAGKSPSQTLEDVLSKLNKDYPSYLSSVPIQSARTLAALEKKYKEKVKIVKKTAHLEVPITRSGKASNTEGLPFDTLPKKVSYGAAISERNCLYVNSLGLLGEELYEASGGGALLIKALTDQYGTALDKYTPPGMSAKVDYTGYKMLSQFCAPYAQGSMALKLSKSEEMENRFKGGLTWTLQALRPDFTHKNEAMERGILVRLSDAAKYLGERESYQRFRNLNGNTAPITESFDAYKCIAPFTSPSFLAMTAAFVFAAVATGGSGSAVLGAVGDGMLLHSGIQLAKSHDRTEYELWCEASGLVGGAALSVYGKYKEKQVREKLQKESIEAEQKAKIEAALQAVEERYARAELPQNSPTTLADAVLEPPSGAKPGEQPPSGSATKKDLGGAYCTTPCWKDETPPGDDLQGAPYLFRITPIRGVPLETLPTEGKRIFLLSDGTTSVSLVNPKGKIVGTITKHEGGYIFQNWDDTNSAQVLGRSGEQKQSVDPNGEYPIQLGEGVKVGGQTFKLEEPPATAEISAPPKQPGKPSETFDDAVAQARTQPAGVSNKRVIIKDDFSGQVIELNPGGKEIPVGKGNRGILDVDGTENLGASIRLTQEGSLVYRPGGNKAVDILYSDGSFHPVPPYGKYNANTEFITAG
ncbi:MAG TPA: hypothetical protein VI874_03935, partial [Candidatus Norongarragalinales archaeon]|nr:hypothetical protein [Candidatus Norongarragalinales archaeon]